MIDKVIRFADKHNMFPASGAVLAGVSGGADSMALLEALLEISKERGFTVSAAHFNHLLRGDESTRDMEFVRGYCAVRGVPFYTESGDVKAHASKHKLSIEAAAREMRYSFFYSAAEKIEAVRIATAHTADDNVETMIINLTRGAGTAGLSGIPPTREIRNSEFGIRNSGAPSLSSPILNSQLSILNSGTKCLLIRPMLRVSGDEVKRFVTERGIPFVEDSTNDLDIYTRNKIRRTVIPVIREINPNYAGTAAAAAELLRADDEYLSKIADDFIFEHTTGRNPTKSNPIGCEAAADPNSQFSTLYSQLGRKATAVPARELAELPLAVSGRVVRKLCGGNASYGHVIAILKLCKNNDPSASLSLPGKTVYREYDRVVFTEDPIAETGGFEPVYPLDGESAVIQELGLKLSCKSVTYNDILHIINKSVTIFLFKKDDICGRIIVRPRREGDKIRLFGHSGTKTLKKLFIERRVPERKRNLLPVIADDSGVLAIYGLGMGDRAVPENGDSAFQISFDL